MTTPTRSIPAALLPVLLAGLLVAGCNSSCGTVGELGNVRFYGQDDGASRIASGTYAVGTRFMVRAEAEGGDPIPSSATAVSTDEGVWTILAPIVRNGELTFDVEAVGAGSAAIEVRDETELLDFVTLEAAPIARYVLQDVAATSGSRRTIFWEDVDSFYLLEGTSWTLRLLPFGEGDSDLIGRAPVEVTTEVEAVLAVDTSDPGIHRDLVLRGAAAGTSWLTLSDPAGDATREIWVGVLEEALVFAMDWWILEPNPDEAEPYRRGILLGRMVADDGAIVLGGTCNFEVLTPELVSLSTAGRPCASNFQAQGSGLAEIQITNVETGVFEIAAFEVTAPQQD
jgi:hypothetical protein